MEVLDVISLKQAGQVFFYLSFYVDRYQEHSSRNKSITKKLAKNTSHAFLSLPFSVSTWEYR